MQIHRDGLRPTPVVAAEVLTAGEVAAHAFPGRVEQLREAFMCGDVVDDAGAPLPPDTLLAAGDRIHIYRPIPDEPAAPIVPVILAEGRGWVAIDKPAAMATMPRGSHVATSATIVVRRYMRNPNVVAAHRLDAATRGVLLLTTDPDMRGAYQGLFERKQVRKRYFAVAPYDAGASRTRVVRRRLERIRGELRTQVVAGEPNSETRIRLREERGGLGLYEVEPVTGKTHQIRAVFADLGMPIVGDWLYPDVGVGDEGRLQLLARSLEFVDPVTGVDVRIVSRQRLNWEGWDVLRL